MSSPAILFERVSKSYPIYDSPSARLKELLTAQRKSYHRDFWALREVSFEVHRGQTFCIVGENGSGKSTLLQIVAGILHPSSGSVSVNGRVAALLELGSGFNPEFSGRDNVYLNAAILGLSRREVDRKFGDIEAFAEIGSFIDQPVKTYSSGMAVRLAFAVAIHVDPEILLVDEALAVGDIYFRQRCLRKVHELRERGVTILFVSHAIGDVKAIGDRVLWLENGHVRGLGQTEHVITEYMAEMVKKDSAYLTGKHERQRRAGGPPVQAPEVVRTIPNIDHRWGNGDAEVLGIAILDPQGLPVPILEPGASITVRISVAAHKDVDLPVVGFMLRNHLGLDFAGTNSAREDIELPPLPPGGTLTVDFHVELPQLYPGSFSFSPAIACGTLHSYEMCDWIDNAITLQMMAGEQPIYGHLHLPCRVSVNGAALDRAAEAQLG